MHRDQPTQPQPNSSARRLLLSSLVGGGALAGGWVTPVVQSLLLPSHAQNSRGLDRHPGSGTYAPVAGLRQNLRGLQNTDICDANPFSLRSDSRISVLIRQHSSYQYRYGFIYYDDYTNNNIAASLPPSNPNGTSEGQALLLLQVVAPLQVKVENIGHGSAWEVRSAVLDVGQYYGGASETYRYQLTVFNNEVTPRTRHDTYVVFALSIDAESGATFVQGQIGPDCVVGSLATTAAPLITTTPAATTPAPTTPAPTTPAPTTPAPTTPAPTTPAPTTPAPTTPAPTTPAPTTPAPTTPAPTTPAPTTPAPTTPAATTPAPTTPAATTTTTTTTSAPPPTPTPPPTGSIMLKVWQAGLAHSLGHRIIIEASVDGKRLTYYDGAPRADNTYVIEKAPANTDIVFDIRLVAAQIYKFIDGATATCGDAVCESWYRISLSYETDNAGRHVLRVRPNYAARVAAGGSVVFMINLEGVAISRR